MLLQATLRAQRGRALAYVTATPSLACLPSHARCQRLTTSSMPLASLRRSTGAPVCLASHHTIAAPLLRGLSSSASAGSKHAPALLRHAGRLPCVRSNTSLVCKVMARRALCSGPPAQRPAAPPPVPSRLSLLWTGAKETAAHYWHGSKLLYVDVRIASKLVRRLVVGRTLSRREHNLLVRVGADIARIVPLSFFVIIPMMEFALPFAIRLFPNLLPSTFEEKHQKGTRSWTAAEPTAATAATASLP